MLKIPVFCGNRVFHVGDLDIMGKGRRGSSKEGLCLSVSECPVDWIGVAKIGGYPIWSMVKKNGPGTFIDIHRVMKMPKLVKLVIDWCFLNGLLEKKKMFRAWEYDSEEETHRFGLHETKKAALHELGVTEEECPVGTPSRSDDFSVEEVTVLVGTDKLCESIGDKQAAKNDCLDFGVMLWAEQFKGIDGAWWDDDYAPGRLSLPRGGIFPEKLGEWIASSEQENIKKLKRSWLSVDTQLIDK